MQVEELQDLGKWYGERIPVITKLYQRLLAPIEHNATQQAKQEVRPALDALITGLLDMPLSALTLEQSAKLEQLGVRGYMGAEGAAFVRSIVATEAYDPATAMNELRQAQQLLSSTTSQFNNLLNVLRELQYEESRDFPVSEDNIVVRVRFQSEASIENITDLKKSSTDWYDIGRAMAMAVGDNPNDVRVLGAANGSIIVILGTTALVATALAIMARRACDIVLHVYQVRNVIEDFRSKRVVNKIIEDELKKQVDSMKANAVDDTVSEIKQRFKDTVKKEHDAAIKRAVEKYFEFHGKGGNLDIITPPQNDGEEAQEEFSVVRELTQNVEVIREIQDQVRYLANHPLDGS